MALMLLLWWWHAQEPQKKPRLLSFKIKLRNIKTELRVTNGLDDVKVQFIDRVNGEEEL